VLGIAAAPHCTPIFLTCNLRLAGWGCPLIDDLGMVPAFNMLGRGNRLHGKGFGMMQNLVDPSAGWGYPLQCSPTVRAGGKVFGGLPILPDKTAEYKAIDRRRLLTENGLPYVDLESRFYAVLKGCSSGLALNPRRSKSREPKRPKAAKEQKASKWRSYA
jgi:hypothetical protein